MAIIAAILLTDFLEPANDSAFRRFEEVTTKTVFLIAGTASVTYSWSGDAKMYSLGTGNCLTFTTIKIEERIPNIVSNKVLPKLNDLASGFLSGFAALGANFVDLVKGNVEAPVHQPATHLGSFSLSSVSVPQYFLVNLLVPLLLLALFFSSWSRPFCIGPDGPCKGLSTSIKRSATLCQAADVHGAKMSRTALTSTI